MDPLTSHLKNLGLNNYEAIIYSSLLKTSPSGATTIAKKCNLARSSVYTTLNNLISKGLVGVTYKNEVKQFIAEDLSVLEQILAEQKNSLDKKFQLIKEVGRMVNSQKDLNIPQIVFFEGQEGLKKIYISMLRQATKGSVMFVLRDEFIWDKDWEFTFGDDWQELVNRLKKEKNITTKLLVNHSKEEVNKTNFYDSRFGLEYKLLPKKFKINKFSLYVLSDMVSILSMEKNNFVGIQITNQSLADNFQTIFETLWHK